MQRQRLLIASTLVAAVLGSAALASASSSSEEPAPRYEVENLDRATDTQREVIETIRSDGPIPVVDQGGKEQGFVRDSALTARDERVTAKIVDGFREAKGQYDPEYNRVYEALRVLDPVPVVDESGDVVGYFTSRFLSTDDLKARTPDAQTTVADSLQN